MQKIIRIDGMPEPRPLQRPCGKGALGAGRREGQRGPEGRHGGGLESEALPDDAALRAAIEDLGFDCLSIENA